MKDTIISIFFSNGDSLEIDLKKEIKENKSDFEKSDKVSVQNATGYSYTYSSNHQSATVHEISVDGVTVGKNDIKLHACRN